MCRMPKWTSIVCPYRFIPRFSNFKVFPGYSCPLCLEHLTLLLLLYNSSMGQVLFISILVMRKLTGPEIGSNLPRVTQQQLALAA